MKNSINFIIYLLFYTIGNILALLPLWVLYVISDFNYFIVYYLIKYRKKVVFENLRNAFPEKSEEEIVIIAKKFYHHFCDLFIEIIKIFNLSYKQSKKRMHFVNPELINEEYNRSKHILTVLGHYNNWEWVNSVGRQMPYCFASIYKPLSNKYIDKLMIRFRTKFGEEVIPMNQTGRYIVQNMKDGKLTMLNFLSDQSPMRHEVQYWATFFNQKTPVYLGIEKLAIKTKQPVYYLHLHKIKRGYYSLTFQKLCDDASILKPYELTDLHVKILEDHIREFPQYWLWSHRRWKIKPENTQS